jgi:hypothetical protein
VDLLVVAFLAGAFAVVLRPVLFTAAAAFFAVERTVAVAFLAGDFFATVFFATVFFATVFLAVAFVAVRFAGAFFAGAFLAVVVLFAGAFLAAVFLAGALRGAVMRFASLGQRGETIRDQLTMAAGSPSTRHADRVDCD